MPIDDRLAELLSAMGRLQGAVEALQIDTKDAKESRGRMYDKLEKIEGDVVIVGQVAAQARAEAAALKDVVEHDVKPVTDEVKRMRLMGMGAIAVIGFAFTALGITVATVGEGVVNAIRSWLRIS